MRPNEDIKKLITDLKINPSAELDARVHSSIDDALAEKTKIQPAQFRPSTWRIIMRSTITKFAVATIIIAAVIVGIHYFGGGGAKPCLAWDCVIRSIMDANTAEFDIIVGEEGKAPVIHDMIMGSKIRRTLSGMAETSIIDLSASQILSLDPVNKKAVYVSLKDLPQMPNYMDTLRNVITMLESTPGFTVEDTGDQVIDGQTLRGFKAKHPKAEIEIWADTKTGLPVRIEQQEGQMKVICKNMRFDMPMEESLFDMNAPEGYKVEKQELNLLSSTEEDFIEGLRVQAEVLGNGVFPDDVSIEHLVKITPTIKEKFDKLTVSDEQKTQLGLKLQKGIMFIRFFKGEGKWIYAGKGVKLGDTNTAIFWYRPAGSRTYHVIYGDLQVEDVEETNLPEPIEKGVKEPIGYQQWDKDSFVGTEQDQWHITADGNIVAHSYVTVTKTPRGASVMPVKLPYRDAILESASLGDVSAAFSRTVPGQYNVNLPLEKMQTGTTEIEFVWTLPLSSLQKTQEMYRTVLISLIPVIGYKLTIVLDDGCGYVFLEKYSQNPAEKKFVPFFSNGPEPKSYFGSCGIAIKPIEQQ